MARFVWLFLFLSFFGAGRGVAAVPGVERHRRDESVCVTATVPHCRARLMAGDDLPPPAPPGGTSAYELQLIGVILIVFGSFSSSIGLLLMKRSSGAEVRLHSSCCLQLVALVIALGWPSIDGPRSRREAASASTSGMRLRRSRSPCRSPAPPRLACRSGARSTG